MNLLFVSVRTAWSVEPNREFRSRARTSADRMYVCESERVHFDLQSALIMGVRRTNCECVNLHLTQQETFAYYARYRYETRQLSSWKRNVNCLEEKLNPIQMATFK